MSGRDGPCRHTLRNASTIAQLLPSLISVHKESIIVAYIEPPADEIDVRADEAGTVSAVEGANELDLDPFVGM